MAKNIIVSVNAADGSVYTNAKSLGINGENLGGQIIVEFFNGEFVNGAAKLDIQRGDEAGYVEMTKDAETKTYRLEIKTSLLAVVGIIKMQVNITQTKKGAEIPVFKSKVFELNVEESIEASAQIPEQYPTWLETANAKIAEMNALMETVENKVSSGEFDGVSVVGATVTEVEEEPTSTFPVTLTTDNRSVISNTIGIEAGKTYIFDLTITDNEGKTVSTTVNATAQQLDDSYANGITASVEIDRFALGLSSKAAVTVIDKAIYSISDGSAEADVTKCTWIYVEGNSTTVVINNVTEQQ